MTSIVDALGFLVNPPGGDARLTAGADELSTGIPAVAQPNTWSGPQTFQGGVDGVFADFATGSPGTPVTVNEFPSTTPFDAVTVSTGGTLTYDNSISFGSVPMWARFTAVNQGAAVFIRASMGHVDYTSFGRAYLTSPIAPPQDWVFVQWFADQTVPKCRITITPGNRVQISDTSFAHVLLSNTVLTANQKYRIEWKATREVAGNDGTITAVIYLGDATDPIESLTLVGLATGKYVDTVYFGSINNSRFFTGSVAMAAFADGCRAAQGPYTGPPAYVVKALSQGGSNRGGFDASGELLGYSQLQSDGDSGHYRYRPGMVMFRVDRYGNLLGGLSLLANSGNPIGGASVPDFAFGFASGRVGARSGILAQANDPPDWTFTRYGVVNNEASGTDGTVNNGAGGPGNIFTSPTVGCQSIDVNRQLQVNGVNYIITSVLSPTSCTLEDSLGNPASLNVAGATWSIPYHPYPRELRGGGGEIGQLRTAPGARPFIRGGGDGVVNGTTTFVSALAAFTTADVGRYIMLNDDPTRLYKVIAFVNVTTVTFNTADPNVAAGVTWRMCGSDTDGGASPLSIDTSTTGWNMGDNATGVDIAAHFASDGSREYGPTDWYCNNANKALYSTGVSMPVNLVVRYDGRVEIPNRLTLTAPGLTNRSVAPTDVQVYRSAINRETHTALIDATSLAVATRQKAGAPVDGDWAAAPPNATLVVDSTNNKLWARVGGVWKGVVIA